MTYYKVVLSGENIFFENDSEAPEPIIGFVSMKVIKAESEELSIATAKRDLLVHWNNSFNKDRRMGLPKLNVEQVSMIKPWMKPKTRHDYYWFTNPEHKNAQLQKLTQSRFAWFKNLFKRKL
jgi:hypothetical protein